MSFRLNEIFIAEIEIRRSLIQEIDTCFPSFPKGSYVGLDPLSKQYILDNIRHSYSNAGNVRSLIKEFALTSHKDHSLDYFLKIFELDARTVYRSKGQTFRKQLAKYGAIPSFEEPIDKVASKALRRFSKIDSRRWIQFLLDLLETKDFDHPENWTEKEQTMLKMFYITLFDRPLTSYEDSEYKNNLQKLLDSPNFLIELEELLKHQFNQIDFVDVPVELDFETPLDIYSSYTKDQLLIALGDKNPVGMQAGVRYIPKNNLDVLLVTLDKSDKGFTEATSYADYAINENQFHWQT